MKWILCVMLASIVGALSNPEILMASDSVTVKDISNTGAVQMVPLPVTGSEEPVGEFLMPAEAEMAPVTVASYNATLATASVAPVYSAPVSAVYVEPVDNIKIAGNTVEILDANTDATPDNAVGRLNAKFLFGHNTSGVFGGIVKLGAGSNFTVTYGGATKTYQVVRTEVYEKIDDYTLRVDGANVQMTTVTKAKHDISSETYDIALMTCYGTMYGNGDASHRFVIFANEV